jgi:hypothetical protein
MASATRASVRQSFARSFHFGSGGTGMTSPVRGESASGASTSARSFDHTEMGPAASTTRLRAARAPDGSMRASIRASGSRAVPPAPPPSPSGSGTTTTTRVDASSVPRKSAYASATSGSRRGT